MQFRTINLPEAIVDEASLLMLQKNSIFDSKVIWFTLAHVYFAELWETSLNDEKNRDEFQRIVLQKINKLIAKGILNEKKFGVKV